MGTGISFFNVLAAVLALIGMVLAFLSSNYVAAAWAFTAFIAQAELATLKDY